MIDLTYISTIQDALKIQNRVFWKDHALMRMRQRGICVDDIIETLLSGQVIEVYQTDKPFPSVLVNGLTKTNRPLHVVVGVNMQAKEIHIVTGYEPDPFRWDMNFSKRK
jgi:hypothetical protein